MRAERRARAEVLELVAVEGCPACHAGERAERRFFWGFVTEHYLDTGVIAAYSASLGFCGAHTRALAARHEAQWVAPTVYRYVVEGALRRLRSRAADRVGGCPACQHRRGAEGRAVEALLPYLGDRDVLGGYRRGGGLCWSHGCRAVIRATAEQAQTLVECFLEALGGAGQEVRRLAFIAGLDSDAPARIHGSHQGKHVLERLLSTGEPPSTLDLLHRRLEAGCCPVCLAGLQLEGRYASWLSEACVTNPRSIVADGVWLCPRHLHDLAREEPATASWLTALMCDRLKGEVEEATRRLSALPRASVAARLWAILGDRSRREGGLRETAGKLVRTVMRPPRRELRDIGDRLARQRPCHVCDAVATAERRAMELVIAALADGPTRQLYLRSHGLCFRHAAGAWGRPGASLFREVLGARLAVLAWELDEVGRKSSWTARHEPKGPERTAWRRAATLVDGRAFG
ncbi:MAG TPA: hypothetical protein VNI61_09580 [Gemmatimonadales bacterium]|nr:hypothetical protein [Gemmatimonadales bacterium]